MKRIIEGKTFNTETAVKVCATGNGLNPNDFAHERSALYVTKKGAWFIAGRGGPSSRFARKISTNGRTDGEGIIVLSREAALTECEKYGDAADVEEFFGDMIAEA